MRLRCPVCHAEAALEAWAADEAAREMMALLAGLDAELGRPLIAYLGLFRSASRSLSWDRALRLLREALALCPDSARLAQALAVTVEQLRAKRDAGEVRPLTNHNYLKRVLEGMPEGGAVVVERKAVQAVQAVQASKSRTLAAVSGFLSGVARDDA